MSGVENKLVEDDAVERHVLVVEDDIFTQQFMRVALGKYFIVHVSDSANAARSVLESQPIVLILMDLSIKGAEDGIDFTRSLRSDPRYAHIPIFALTAHAFDRDRLNALEAGCDRYFSKPFQRDVLLSAIQEVL